MKNGIVVKFDPDRGFGFIREAKGQQREDVFVHVSDVAGKRGLVPGQSVRFEVEQSNKGPRAVRVQPGSVPLSPTRYFLAWVFAPLAILCLAAFFFVPVAALPVYLIGLNLFTFLLYAYDKGAAQRAWRRVPERALIIVALLGGFPAALAAMKILRHKTIKWKKVVR